ncbi:MAG: stage II sporulation protein E [Bacillota bacterium]
MKGIDLPIYQRKDSLEQEEEKKGLGRLIKNVPVLTICLSGLGFLLGRGNILNGLMPFGISYFSIILYFYNKDLITVKKVALIFLAINLGYFSYLGLESSGYLLTSLLLWVFTSNYISKEIKTIYYSLLTAALFLVFKLLKYYLFIQDNSIVLVAEVVMVFLLVLLIVRTIRELLGYFSEKKDNTLIGLLIVVLIFSLFISDLAIKNVFGVNMLRLLSSYLIMLLALTGGSTVASITGVLTGVFYSLSHLELMPLVGNYALAGVIAGSFSKQGKIGVGLGFVASTLIYIIFLSEPGYIIALVKESLIAASLLLLTPESIISYFSLFNFKQQAANKLEDRNLNSFINQRIKRFSHLFRELSIAFNEVAPVYQKKNRNIGVFLDLITDKACKKCDLYQSCWQQSFNDTYQSMFKLLAIAENRGEIEVKTLDRIMQVSCSRKIRLTTTINQFVKMYELNSYWETKLEDNKKILLEQLAGMAEVMDDLASELTINVKPEDKVKEKAYSILMDAGLIINEISVTNYNDEQLEFTIRKKSCAGKKDCIKKMMPLLNNKLGYSLALTWNECGEELGNSSCICQLSPGPKYSFTTGVAVASSDEEISGDNYAFFRLKEEKFIAILSDGMGIGASAFQESKGAVTLLKNMIQSGLSYDSALRTINSILGIRSVEENFATIDLLSVDLITAKAQFAKVGSVSSFIKRDQEVNMVKSTTLPAGILNQIEVEPSCLQLYDGDFIIMITDGILESNPNLTIKEEWIIKLLKNNLIDDPTSLAQYILQKAQQNSNSNDDMTVLVIKVDKC